MKRFALATLACLTATALHAQAQLDSSLVAYIAAVRAIDNHAHPMRPLPPGAAPDTEYDALPLDGVPAFPLPWRLRLDNPEWRAAQAALFDIPNTGTDS